MFPKMHIQCPFGSKRPHALRLRTNQSFHFTVNHQKMIDHLLVITAIHATNRTCSFAMIRLQMGQQMKSVIVGVRIEDAATDATWFCDMSTQSCRLRAQVLTFGCWMDGGGNLCGKLIMACLGAAVIAAIGSLFRLTAAPSHQRIDKHVT